MMFHVKHEKMQHVNQHVAFFFVNNLVGIGKSVYLCTVI